MYIYHFYIFFNIYFTDTDQFTPADMLICYFIVMNWLSQIGIYLYGYDEQYYGPYKFMRVQSYGEQW